MSATKAQGRRSGSSARLCFWLHLLHTQKVANHFFANIFFKYCPV